jgi:hypothetical protein
VNRVWLCEKLIFHRNIFVSSRDIHFVVVSRCIPSLLRMILDTNKMSWAKLVCCLVIGHDWLLGWNLIW